MKLRIYRTWTWELDCSPLDVVLGGRNTMKLVSHDKLQYLDSNIPYSKHIETPEGTWVDVPIVEEPKPEHPRDKEEREKYERMHADMKPFIEKIKSSNVFTNLGESISELKMNREDKSVCPFNCLDGKHEYETIRNSDSEGALIAKIYKCKHCGKEKL
jgi:hypothetical protein